MTTVIKMVKKMLDDNRYYYEMARDMAELQAAHGDLLSSGDGVTIERILEKIPEDQRQSWLDVYERRAKRRQTYYKISVETGIAQATVWRMCDELKLTKKRKMKNGEKT
jgi:hypothetical protein